MTGPYQPHVFDSVSRATLVDVANAAMAVVYPAYIAKDDGSGVIDARNWGAALADLGNAVEAMQHEVWHRAADLAAWDVAQFGVPADYPGFDPTSGSDER